MGGRVTHHTPRAGATWVQDFEEKLKVRGARLGLDGTFPVNPCPVTSPRLLPRGSDQVTCSSVTHSPGALGGTLPI